MAILMRDTDFSKITVSKVCRGFKGLPESGKFDFMDNGGIIRIIYYKPTVSEIKEIGQGDVQFKIIEEHGILFLLVKFGKLNWMDFPYHIDLSIWLTERELPEVKDSGYAITIVLADGFTGVVKVIRQVSLPVSMSKQIKEIVDRQKETIQSDYNDRIARVYATYSTDDLVRLASSDSKSEANSDAVTDNSDTVKEDKKLDRNLLHKNKSMAGKQKYELFDGSSKIFPVGTDPRGKVDLFNLKRITTWSPDGTPHILQYEDRFKEIADGEFVTFEVLPHVRKAVEQELRNAKISCEYVGFKKGQKTSNSLSFDAEVLKIKANDKEAVNELLRKYD